jgi:hypothetical protein
MARTVKTMALAGLAIGLVLLLAPGARAQDEEDEAEAADDEEEAEEEEEEEEEEEAEAEAEEVEEEAASAEVEQEFSSPFDVEEDEEDEEPAASEEAKVLQGTWTKHIMFATDDGSFKFQPRGWVQPRFGLVITPAKGDDPAPLDNVIEGTGFRLQRARLGFQAWLFDFAHIYLDADFSSGAGFLIDYFADLDPFDGAAVLRAGFFRPFFCRQLLAATTQLLMVDYARAWTDPMLDMGLGRDMGAGLFGLVADTFEYGVGAWNGDRRFSLGRSEPAAGVTAPGNTDFVVGGRLAVHPLAPAGIGRPLPVGDESDSAISEDPALAVGVAALYNKRHDRVIEVSGVPALYYDNQLKIGADLAFQWSGLAIQGEFFYHKVWIQDDADPRIIEAVELYKINPRTGDLIDGDGFGAYGQVSYFVMPRQLEVAARFDMVDESTHLRGKRLYPAAGATYYFFGNNLKLQLMYRLSMGTGYEDQQGVPGEPGYIPADPGYIDTGHDIILMLQASI